MKSCLLVATALALAGSATADDVLVSKRMNKRFIDDEGNFNMSFIHVNDVHAHLDEFSSSGTDCEEPEEGCFGGYARIKTEVDALREEHPDSLLLNAGDEFQGTLFYSFYGPEKIAETVNALEFDIMTIGNHEFDGGDEELGEFLQNLTFPVVSCNIKSEVESINSTLKNFHIFEDYELAVIGATTETTPFISSVGEGTTFLDPIEEIMKSVYEIRNTTEIRRIVVLSHLGYDVDQELAEQSEGISLIIGGHSHTLLGDMEDAEGDYPTIVEDSTGEEVFIVTAYRWGEYLGYIDLTFDTDGRALAYHGAPIHMTNETAQDEDLQETVDGWRGPFEEFAAEVVGETSSLLDQETCQDGDCLLGEVMTDAMLEYRVNSTEGTDAPAPDLALINAGGIRASINVGDITRGEVLTSFPFGNAIVELMFTGEELWDILEGCVSGVNQESGAEVSSWFQVSAGTVIEYNPDNEAGSVLVSVEIDGEELDLERDYRVVTLDFLAGGGDSIFQTTTDFITLDTQDEVLVGYIEARTPLSPELEERVVAVSGNGGGSGGDEEDSEGGDGGEGEGEGEGESGEGGNGGEGEGGEGEAGEGAGEGEGEGAAGIITAPIWGSLLAVAIGMLAL